MTAKLGIAACAILLSAVSEVAAVDGHVLADPAAMLGTAERVDFVGQNAFAREASEFGPVLRSTPSHSASGLYLPVAIEPGSLRPVVWRWRVDRLQSSADIRDLGKEDFGATIFFIFGEPSFFNKDVPTLAYTWTATPVRDGTTLQSLRYHSLRYIQLRGRAEVGTWEQEQRDLVADYKLLFKQAPPPLKYVAIFNDNDQTGEPVTAWFGRIEWVR